MSIAWPLVFRSETAFKASDWPESRRLFDKALARSGRAPWLYVLRYRMKQAAGAPGALRDLDTGLRADPGASWVFGLAPIPAEVLPEGGSLVRMLRSFADEPACAPVFAYRGQARLFRGDKAGGVSDLEHAVALDPGAGWIFGWLGEGLRQAGRVKDAGAAFNEALRLSPRDANALAWRATLRLGRGDAGGALQDLERSIEIRPTARGYKDLAKALHLLGEISRSLDALQNAVTLNPELTWGDASPAGLARSLVEIRAASASTPRDGRLDAWEGETLVRLARPAEALTALNRAKRKAPRFAWSRVWRAQALAALGRRGEARAELAEARRKAPNYAPAHWTTAALEMQEGRAAAAVLPLSRAIRLAPYSARPYLARAGALLQLGRKSAAKRDLTHCLRLCPGFPEALRLGAAIDGGTTQKIESFDVAEPVPSAL